MALSDIATLKGLAIAPGSVFRMTLTPRHGIVPKNQGDASRDKYFVVLGLSDDSLLVGSVLINSEINDRLAPVISPFQLVLDSSKYNFLNGRNRFLDCFEIKQVSFREIIELGSYIGRIEENDLSAAILLCNDSEVNTDATLKYFGIFCRSNNS